MNINLLFLTPYNLLNYGGVQHQINLMNDYISKTSNIESKIAGPNSNDYDLEIREQAEARNHRIGTTNKVTYVDLVCEGTVDDNILKSLRQKINIATQIMGEEFKQWLI